MITIEEVSKRIRHELRGKLPPETVIDENTTMEDLSLSSLQVADIVFELEEDYGVEFDAAKAADAKTLGQLIAVANEALPSGATPSGPTDSPAVAEAEAAVGRST